MCLRPCNLRRLLISLSNSLILASIEERRRKVSGSDNESGSGSGSGSGIEGASDEMISKSVEMVVLVVVVPVAVMAVRWDQST